jgi:stage V sporulation protein AF
MIIVCYANGIADADFVKRLDRKLLSVDTDALSMGHESLAECLLHQNWWNPFQKFRYTERPDAACAMIMEGSVIIMVDNSPQVMLLPCSLFDFLQETDDFYFPPLVGSYMRVLRGLIFLISMIITPVWYFLMKNPQIIPASLDFLKLAEEPHLPLILQILLVEFLMDGLKLASMNTPSSLNSSFGVIGALVLGEFAVSAGWFVAEVVLYMAFVALTNYTQPSFELGYAFKLFRNTRQSGRGLYARDLYPCRQNVQYQLPEAARRGAV